ncbi:Putative oxidoreductase, NADH-binding protein [Neorhizobium galegae bv. officinalis]|uniref:Putative oxidoreductase, NADH-binding protein n=1 Tax=Neorhizobium galegae bv. officinalis TaxID=323656 RepID=A0A0T7FFQ4_NEOGA|nr:Gfo/Idh/MocA family oxidoreductase [Neorhizobium galegae]CDZ33799.1 Putative oxidoreductase, NADH-binding protein [Neorhizobium galegae bv. officinalis]
MNEMISEKTMSLSSRPVRLGFLGVGWIGRHRMQAIIDTGIAEAVAIADPSVDMAAEAKKIVPGAALANDFDGLLAHSLDGIVIATPSAQHADQSIRALRAGVSVFCQKPLGRSAEEVAAVVGAARASDRLLGVDFSYRHTAGMNRIREIVRTEELGKIFAADLVFHNAYGPDKPWFYDKAESGGGCLMDLGVHLVDMALWSLDFPAVASVSGHLMAGGRPINDHQVEDYAVANVTLGDGMAVRLACSWRLQAGREAIVEASFYGTNGGISMRNVDGSFYDFTLERFYGTSRETLIEPPDDWGGRAAAGWARRLAAGERYDPACEKIIDVGKVIDRIYSSSREAAYKAPMA